MALPIQRPTMLFTPGRTCPLEAVVLHAYASGIEMLNLEMNRCPRPRPNAPRKCHDSFHFGIGNCNFTQYVAIADTAWGFYFIPTPVCPVPPCPIIQTCDGIGVDQYNTDLDGNLPTPPVGVGPDGTANCAVIHVAISTGSNNLSLCPELSPQAYKCLVRDLCYIFAQAGLTPVSGVTLLTHIGELVDLDLDQLAVDIQECLDFVPPPLPPCDCAVTITATDTNTINFTAVGNNITGSVIISPDAGNTLVAQANGLFVPATDVTLTAIDTTCLDLTITESPDNTFTVSGAPVISPTLGNQLTCSPNGLFVPPTAVSDVSITAVDTDTVDLTIIESPANTFTVQADVISIPPVAFCAAVAALPTGPLLAPGHLVLTQDGCDVEAFPTFCELFTASPTPVVGADLTPGDLVLGTDCQAHAFPNVVPLLGCEGNPLVAGSFMAYASQISAVDRGSTSLVAGIVAPDQPPPGDCGFAGQILHAPLCDDPTVQNTNLNGEVYIGADDLFPGSLAWKSRFSDPVFNVGGNGTLDLAVLRAAGQNVIVINNGGSAGTTTLTNPPTGCADRHLWIKNISTTSESISAVELIDGQATITLDGVIVAGYPFGNNGGEAVHLVWNDALSTWHII